MTNGGNMAFTDRLAHAWNAFMQNRDPTKGKVNYGTGYYYRPDRPRFSRGNERSIVTSVLNRISMDAATAQIKHIYTDENGRYVKDSTSSLNYCLTTEANIDQTGRAFLQDIVMSMLDEGVVAVVPVDTNTNVLNGSFDIESMRTAKIVQYYPRFVKVNVYNDITGQHQELMYPKEKVSIIENPMYAVMNEPNSTLQRLMHKLSLLDIVDEQTSSGKLDIIIQLPFSVKNEARKKIADERRQDIADQLAGSKYGIAYTDGTEKITQLNRPAENNLMAQIEYLTNQLYSQLGLTIEILNGTADETAMTNYYTRTIEPILSAITDEMKRKFLSKTARTQGQTIMFFRDPFKLVPLTAIASIIDPLSRNEITTSNEMRQILGMKPADQPSADELRNKNMPMQDEPQGEYDEEEYDPNNPIDLAANAEY